MVRLNKPNLCLSVSKLSNASAINNIARCTGKQHLMMIELPSLMTTTLTVSDKLSKVAESKFLTSSNMCSSGFQSKTNVAVSHLSGVCGTETH